MFLVNLFNFVKHHEHSQSHTMVYPEFYFGGYKSTRILKNIFLYFTKKTFKNIFYWFNRKFRGDISLWIRHANPYIFPPLSLKHFGQIIRTDWSLLIIKIILYNKSVEERDYINCLQIRENHVLALNWLPYLHNIICYCYNITDTNILH